MTGDDRDLRELFSSLRRDEETRVPPISLPALTGRAHVRRWMPGRLVVATACLAAMVAAAVWLLPLSRSPHEGFDRERQQTTASITSWKADTDFLLETPGRELLQGVPAIGEQRAATKPGPVVRHQHSKKQVFH